MADRALDANAVVAAALELLDEVGLRAFTMRRLAQRLGTYPATIYWHVGNRDEVLTRAHAVLLRELVAGLPDADVTPWDVWLVACARSYRRMIHAHPAFGEVSVTRFDPEVLAPDVLELIVGVLARAGFRDSSLVGAYNTWIGSMCGWIAIEVIDGAASEGFDADKMEASVRALPASDYPTIVANVELLADRAFTFRWNGGATRPLDESFEFALATWIAGLRALAEQG